MTDFRTIWGDEAHHHLKNIKGKGARKKQRTLTLLVDAIAGGGSITRTLNHYQHDSSVGSKQSHYNWLAEDEAYAKAYTFLIGTDKTPGLARDRRQQEQDDELTWALQKLETAKVDLMLLVPEAVKAIQFVLDKRNKEGQKVSDYALLQAAGMILDRQHPTAKQERVSHSFNVEDLAEQLPDLKTRLEQWHRDHRQQNGD